MGTAIPALEPIADQSQIRLVNQGRGLKSLTRLLTRQFLGRQTRIRSETNGKNSSVAFAPPRSVAFKMCVTSVIPTPRRSRPLVVLFCHEQGGFQGA